MTAYDEFVWLAARKRFRPLPLLWDAFIHEPDLVDILDAMSFDGMMAVGKLQATDGTEAARAKLRAIAATPDRPSRAGS